MEKVVDRGAHIGADLYEAFRTGDFKKVQQLAAERQSEDPDEGEWAIALRSATYWVNQLSPLEDLPSPWDKVQYLFREYAKFTHGYLPRLGIRETPLLFPLRYFLFHELSLNLLSSPSLVPQDRAMERQINMAVVRCHKLSGDYRKALILLERDFADSDVDDSEVLAEYGDCLDMISQGEKARLLFRDAFYGSPKAIGLDYLLSPVIQAIRWRVLQEEHVRDQLAEWIPVYGVLMGFFTVRRRLNPHEVSRLKQEITNLKLEYTQHHDSNRDTLPRLLYRYFILFDHYRDSREERSKCDEILLSIKMIHPKIYEMFTSL